MGNEITVLVKQIHLQTIDNVKLSIWHYSKENKQNTKNIFLTHGTFSNKNTFKGIVEYFVKYDYTCWVLEWRNHGDSSKVQKYYNFETIANIDIKTTFDYLINDLDIENIHCITHSGGGICLSIFLINFPKYKKHIQTITMFACQVFGAANSRFNYTKILFAKYLCSIIKTIPGKLLKIGEENEPYYLMEQWFNWNLNKNFTGKNGTYYLQKIIEIEIPILSICAESDKFIAPKQGCYQFLKSFKNNENKFVVCSKENGFKEDYSHSRIILSRNASKEVWQICRDWII